MVPVIRMYSESNLLAKYWKGRSDLFQQLNGPTSLTQVRTHLINTQ